ncbi:hypothetical protein [Methylomagnum ishizawai]|uniref:hypothetical protein n=1 Tax=Methylomagnum ishizawai TaxID=1760988 RepID=UPI001C340370|nr:hypothetical protein [Methylomagnum ishizawai]BBL75606.1 hypothetical protein MishRS11D_27040 [Methylomagnum ishizawai]
MTDLKIIRRERLRQLINEMYGGHQASFAHRIERAPDYISRCLTGNKGIGEELARSIEREFQLPDYWMDRAKSTVEPSMDELQWLHGVEKSVKERMIPEHIRAAINTLIDSAPPRAA